MSRTSIARHDLTAGLMAASVAANAATPTHELMICVSKVARASTVKCVKDGERYDQAETTLFAQYAQGWRLVSSLVHTEGYTGEKTMVPHTFFLERPKN